MFELENARDETGAEVDEIADDVAATDERLMPPEPLPPPPQDTSKIKLETTKTLFTQFSMAITSEATSTLISNNLC